jgi:MFS family permease
LSEQRQFSEYEKKVTLWGVAIVFLLSALDQTIVSTAMPRIIAELNGLALYSWVTTAYLLSSTVMVPIWGKLGDLYGASPSCWRASPSSWPAPGSPASPASSATCRSWAAA